MIEATIEVPRCWSALLDLPDFDELPEYPESEKTEHSADDPRPFYDDGRSVSVILTDGNVFTLFLMSGQSNYFADYDINGPDFYRTHGEAFHRLDDGEVLDGIDGYRVTVKLVGAEVAA